MKIYISYKREDSHAADHVAAIMAAGGHEVLSERNLIPGADWAQAIERMIRDSDVVAVLWSKASLESDFVFAEAQLAVETGKYLGFTLGKVELPLGFRRVQHVLLGETGGEPKTGAILSALEEFGGRSLEARSSNRTVRQASKRERKSPPQQSIDLDIPPFLRRAPDVAETVAPPPPESPQPIPEATAAPPATAATGAASSPTDAAERGYDVFISYSRKDEEACKLVFNLLVERGLVPWYDKDIGSGAFKTKIVTRISKAAVFVLLLSKNSVASQNVSKELSVASGSDRLIIPISIDGISVGDLNDTFRYELIELNIFSANPAVPESWTEVVKTIGDSVSEVRAEVGAAVPVPPTQPLTVAPARKAKRPIIFAGVSAISAMLQQTAVGYVLWANGADIRQAIAAAFISGVVIYPLAFLTALIARVAFRASAP